MDIIGEAFQPYTIIKAIEEARIVELAKTLTRCWYLCWNRCWSQVTFGTVSAKDNASLGGFLQLHDLKNSKLGAMEFVICNLFC